MGKKGKQKMATQEKGILFWFEILVTVRYFGAVLGFLRGCVISEQNKISWLTRYAH